MPKFHSVTISFKPEYSHLYEFLKAKDNMSAYILRLISKDLKQTENYYLRNEIKNILKEVLDGNISFINKTIQDSPSESLTEEDITIINEYF